LEILEKIMKDKKPLVGIIMGSDSDWPTMEASYQVCCEFNIPAEVRVVSAHRMPDEMARYARSAHQRGLRVIIAGAGGAAHLPGMVASHTPLPVIGVPVESKSLKGLDSLLSIVQMPGGIPVATVAIGGARNAGLLAAAILGAFDEAVRRQVLAFKKQLAAKARSSNQQLQKKLAAR
jgi:5-(carboxyamino)imidazole ribonucleotide mutase